MKRTIGVVIMTVLMAGTQAFGWGLPSVPSIPGFGGGAAESGEKVDVAALSSRDAAIKMRLYKASVTLASGLIEVEKACGRAAEAAKLEATLEEAKKNPADTEGTKKLCTDINNASDAMKEVDLNSSMSKSEARLRLGKALLLLGAGSLLDVQAVNDARNLVSDIASGLRRVQASPMTYGLAAAKDLGSGLSTAKFVIETVPSQLSTIGSFTSGLVKYARTNKIDIPSQADLEKQSKDIEKE